MKKTCKLFFFIPILLLILQCEKGIDYGNDIADLKQQISLINSRLDSLTTAIKSMSNQLTNIDASLKLKINNSNSRIDSISMAFINLKNQVGINSINISGLTSSISELVNDIKTINSSIDATNVDLKKKTDAIKLSIDSTFLVLQVIDASLEATNQNADSLNSKLLSLKVLYNDVLSNYLDILNIVKTSLSVTEINGTVFKGSFLRGSLLFFYELDSNLVQTGRSFNSTIKDDYGNFILRAQNLNGKLVRVIGDGFYWNEVLNENSSSRITLTSIAKIDSNETVNVNVLTHIERLRVEYLYTEKGYSFDSAKTTAITEVLSAFGFINTGITRAEKVGLFGVGKESKILIAISTMIQGFRTESEVTQILNDIGEDIEKDGTLDDVSIGDDLVTHIYYVDTTNVIQNIKNKYGGIYNKDTINTLNLSFLKIFIETLLIRAYSFERLKLKVIR